MLALVIFILLPFNILTWGLRFYVRISRKSWGADDWSMVVAIPLFIICTISMIGIAFTGGGKKDVDLTAEERRHAMFWWFIMETIYCIAAIPVKWSICFMLLRIAQGKRAYEFSIYAIMASVAIVMLLTTVYEFLHCTPIRMNWEAVKGGSCKPQRTITWLSFAFSGVTIFSDWFCAIAPIPLLWAVQIDFRVKASIVALLSLGILASIAAIGQLTVTINLNASTDFLYHAMPVAAWAQAELAASVILANLATIRPVFDKVFDIPSAMQRSKKRDDDPISGETSLEHGQCADSKRRRSQLRHSSARPPSGFTMSPAYYDDLVGSRSSLGADDKSTNHTIKSLGQSVSTTEVTHDP